MTVRREVLALAAMSFALAMPAAGANRELRAANIHPADYPTVQTLRQMGEEMARVNTAPMNTLGSGTVMASLPCLFRSGDHLHKVFDGPVDGDMFRRIQAIE